MKKLVILGAGTAGTMMANHLSRELDLVLWEIDVIDHRQEHYYQPGYLFLPFDIYEPEYIMKPIKDFIPKGVNLINDKAEKIDALAKNYDAQRRCDTLRCAYCGHRMQYCPRRSKRNERTRMAQERI